MSELTDEDHVICGNEIAKLQPTCELRFVLVNHRNPLTGDYYPPALQQKWVASAKMADGGTWEEHRWRNVPLAKADVLNEQASITKQEA
jgi:hypothetical protein